MEQTVKTILTKHKQTKDIVWNILKQDNRARNDDRWLQLKVLEAMGQNIVIGKDSVIWYIDLNNFTIPNMETTRRARQEIQNKEGQFLPTDPQVMRHRKIKELVIREYYKNNPSLLREWEALTYKVQ